MVRMKPRMDLRVCAGVIGRAAQVGIPSEEGEIPTSRVDDIK